MGMNRFAELTNGWNMRPDVSGKTYNGGEEKLLRSFHGCLAICDCRVLEGGG